MQPLNCVEHSEPASDDIASIETQEWQVGKTTKYGVGLLPYLRGVMLYNKPNSKMIISHSQRRQGTQQNSTSIEPFP